MYLKANSVDTDHMPHSVLTDLDLRSLQTIILRHKPDCNLSRLLGTLVVFYFWTQAVAFLQMLGGNQPQLGKEVRILALDSL